MELLGRHPQLQEALISLAILALAYLGARLTSSLFGRILTRAAQRTASTLDDRLVAALKGPVTCVLFLAGAWAAVERLPLAEKWATRVHHGLFVLAVVLVAVALTRAYLILLRWYVTESGRVGGEGPAREFGPLFSNLGKTFVIVIAVIIVLQSLGVDVASLVVSLGVGSLALGLAAKDTLANMFAGFTIMLDRPFHVGDRIQLSTGEVGDVESIGTRVTRLRTVDETLLLVPNSLLVQDRIVNRNRPTRHIVTRVEVGVAYGTDLARARAVLVEAALASPYVEAERPPEALVIRFGDFSVALRVVFWARDQAEQALASSSVHQEIYRRFAEEGIEIPFPVQRVIQPADPRPAAPEA